MGCGTSTQKPPPATKETVATTNTDVKKPAAEPVDPELVKAVQTWGKTVFAQFDTDKNGFLSNAELSRALKALPPGPQQGSIDDLVKTMDANGDGSLSVMEWLNNLAKVPALAFSLEMVVDSSTGTVKNFRSFEEQKAKREREVAALNAKENRTEEEEKEMVEYERQIKSLEKRIADAAKNAAERAELDDAISKWGKSVFAQVSSPPRAWTQTEQCRSWHQTTRAFASRNPV